MNEDKKQWMLKEFLEIEASRGSSGRPQRKATLKQKEQPEHIWSTPSSQLTPVCNDADLERDSKEQENRNYSDDPILTYSQDQEFD